MWDSIDHFLDLDDSTPEKTGDKQRWDNLQFRMLESCKRIWKAVRDVLCNDSPEGHLPQDIDEIDAIDTKDVLSYSFRATHESRYPFPPISRKEGQLNRVTAIL